MADLGDGLILRRGLDSDADALVALNAKVHARPESAGPDALIAAWTRDLIHCPPPNFNVNDFLVVQDLHSGAIISSSCLIPQTWSYGGEHFGVGRVELVGTHPDFRQRGLVRRQFEVLHAWSRPRGDLVQVINGIPWYYRQFGYEYALEYGGGRRVTRIEFRRLATDGADLYRVRPARPADVPKLIQIDTHARRRYLVSCVRDKATWEYELRDRSDRSGRRSLVDVVEDTAGAVAGYVAHAGRLRHGWLRVDAIELARDVPWVDATTSVLRHIAKIGSSCEGHSESESFDGVNLELGAEHPAYQSLSRLRASKQPSQFSAYVIPPRVWYVRVPDIPEFVHRIAPVIQDRIAESSEAGLTEKLHLSFYREGLELEFRRGRLTHAMSWLPMLDHVDVSFFSLTFLQLLFGYRSIDELSYAFPDCFARDARASALIRIILPKQPSLVWPVS